MIKGIKAGILFSLFLIFSANAYSAEEPTPNNRHEIICSHLGKEAAVQFDSSISGLQQQTDSIYCNNENETAGHSNIIYPEIYKYLFLLLLIFAAIYAFFKTVKVAGDLKNQHMPEVKSIVLITLITLMLIFPMKAGNSNVAVIVYVFNSVFNKYTYEAGEIVKKEIELKKYSFDQVYIPHLDSKADAFENAFEYLTSASASKPNKDIIFYAVEKNGLLQVESYSSNYSAIIQLGIDTKAIEIAKRLGLPDYREYAISRQKEALYNSLVYLNSTVENYGTSIDRIDGSTEFDFNSYACENLPSVDLTNFDEDSVLTIYKKKAAACASEIYLSNLYRYKDFINTEYLENGNYLKNRKIQLCIHSSGERPVNAFNYEEIKEEAKSCVEEACGASGSPFFCSVAMRVYDGLKNDSDSVADDIFNSFKYVFSDLLTNPTKEAQIIGNAFYFDYQKHEDDFIINSKNVDAVFRFNLKTSGNVEFVENSFLDDLLELKEDLLNEIFGIDFGNIGLEGLLEFFSFGNDGILGTTRMQECLKNPYEYLEDKKIECKGNIAEIISYGQRLLETGASIKALNFVMNFKTQNTKENASAEIKGTKLVLEKFATNDQVKIVSFLLGYAAVTNIHNENLKSAEDTFEKAALFSAMVFSESARSIVNAFSNICITVGILFAYIIPIMILYKVFDALVAIMTTVLSFTYAGPISAIATLYSGKHKADNIDVPDYIIVIFSIVISVIMLVYSFHYIDILFSYIFYAIGDLFYYINGVGEEKTGLQLLLQTFINLTLFCIFIFSVSSFIANLLKNNVILVNNFAYSQNTIDYGSFDNETNIQDDRIANKFWSS